MFKPLNKEVKLEMAINTESPNFDLGEDITSVSLFIGYIYCSSCREGGTDCQRNRRRAPLETGQAKHVFRKLRCRQSVSQVEQMR